MTAPRWGPPAPQTGPWGANGTGTPTLTPPAPAEAAPPPPSLAGALENVGTSIHA